MYLEQGEQENNDIKVNGKQKRAINIDLATVAR